MLHKNSCIPTVKLLSKSTSACKCTCLSTCRATTPTETWTQSFLLRYFTICFTIPILSIYTEYSITLVPMLSQLSNFKSRRGPKCQGTPLSFTYACRNSTTSFVTEAQAHLDVCLYSTAHTLLITTTWVSCWKLHQRVLILSMSTSICKY